MHAEDDLVIPFDLGLKVTVKQCIKYAKKETVVVQYMY
jgi:hypothetical protein